MPPARPNLLLILCDDMGFSDIGCYGSEIDTPNLDRLAAEGVRFSHFYNCARCCPTRASLLTGLYPHQTGVGHMVHDDGKPAYRGRISPNCVTIAEALKPAGYRSYMSGKWHVGGDYSVARPETWADQAGDEGHPLPEQRGFDRHYGILQGGDNYWEPAKLRDDGQWVDSASLPPGYHLTDAISDRAAEMVRGHAAAPGTADSPFFLYLAYTAPHWPLHAPEELVAKYQGRYRAGWGALRQTRYERLRDSGLLTHPWELSPADPEAKDWQSIAHPDWEDRRMAVYAAQIEQMDQGIGRVMDALRESGQAENTLVMFLSDNGGCAEFLREDGDAHSWPGWYTRRQRDGSLQVCGNNPNRMPGDHLTFMSYDLSWSNASNTPFRKHKSWTHEGGISTPLICHWPAGGLQPGIRHPVGHVMDIMATCLDAAGAAYPGTHAGQEIVPLEGESLLPCLRGSPWKRDRPLFFEHQDNLAVRADEWKAVLDAGRAPAPGIWELYQMREDRTELHDRAAGESDRLGALTRAHREWAQRVGMIPWAERRKKA